MKKAVMAGAAALTLLDISASTPAQAQSPFDGFYVGTHFGTFDGEATFTSAPYTVTLPGDTFSIAQRSDNFDFDGFIAGGHFGFNAVTTGNIMVGIEIDWTRLVDSDSVSANGAGTGINGDGFVFQRRSEVDFEWQGTVRGRLGTVIGNVLVFATAGVALLEVDWSEEGKITNTTNGAVRNVSHAASDTLVGVAVGGGAEWAITPFIIIGGDYLYEDFESFNSVPHGFANGLTGEIDDVNIHKVRARISFKLGGLTP